MAILMAKLMLEKKPETSKMVRKHLIEGCHRNCFFKHNFP